MIWVHNIEKQWAKLRSSYIMGWQHWETMSKFCVKLCYGFATLHRGRGGIFKDIFKNSHDILSLIVADFEFSNKFLLLKFFMYGKVDLWLYISRTRYCETLKSLSVTYKCQLVIIWELLVFPNLLLSNLRLSWIFCYMVLELDWHRMVLILNQLKHFK